MPTLILVLFFFFPFLSLPNLGLLFLLSACFSHRLSLSLWLPLFASYSRSTRTLSLWPPSGPSPPSTPSATPSIRTELPRSSLPLCHAPSRPCPGSSALSTINETPLEPAAPPLFIASTTTTTPSHPPLPAPLSTSFGPSI